MYDLAVCIPTFKRPDFLKKTILSITQSNLEGSNIRKINIIVVDNDADKTAEVVVGNLMDEIPERYHLQYFNFPQKGLSNVRNNLLEKALQLKPTYVVFIDDDEYASKDWLKELVSAIVRNKSDMVVGRVISVFEHEVPESTSYWFEKGDHPNDSAIKIISSANMIISTEFLSRSGLKFDKRFNSTGAEDTYFGIQAGYEGAQIYWAQNAVVYETVTKNRAKLNWLLRRRFRGAITFIYILGLEKKYLLIIKKIVVSFLYLIIGMAGTVLMLFPIKLKYWGVLKVAEGFGGLAGAVNVKYHEYK
jgi:glycosyltransferase involved in cell wall biosynthesis